jgi:hypothetical protein
LSAIFLKISRSSFNSNRQPKSNARLIPSINISDLIVSPFGLKTRGNKERLDLRATHLYIIFPGLALKATGRVFIQCGDSKNFQRGYKRFIFV